MKKGKPVDPARSQAGRTLAALRKHHRGRAPIQDEFTDLKVSKERKRQLRRRAKGLCVIAGCENPLVTINHCAVHARADTQQSVSRRSRKRKTGKGKKTQ